MVLDGWIGVQLLEFWEKIAPLISLKKKHNPQLLQSFPVGYI